MWCLAGLGNPGNTYEKHRHNAGFMAINSIAECFGAPPFGKKFHGQTAKITVEDVPMLLLKPGTYMNDSGRSVQAALAYYKLPPEQLIVLHDELDLPTGHVRIKRGGGHGGHNGLRSIDSAIGKEYWRIRLGIGHPGHKDRVHGYVLSDFSAAERDIMDPVYAEIARQLPLFWQHSPEGLMNKLALSRPAA
jgi:PTH1 family peptidyl-tRNA hydrolase